MHRCSEFRSLVSLVSCRPATPLLSTPPRASPASLPLPLLRFFQIPQLSLPTLFPFRVPKALRCSSARLPLLLTAPPHMFPKLPSKGQPDQGHQTLGIPGCPQNCPVRRVHQQQAPRDKLGNPTAKVGNCVDGKLGPFCYTMRQAGLSRTPEHRALVSVWSQTLWAPRPLLLVQGSEKTESRPT